MSFPCDQDRMSPSVEKSYNFGLPGHSRQVRASELGGVVSKDRVTKDLFATFVHQSITFSGLK